MKRERTAARRSVALLAGSLVAALAAPVGAHAQSPAGEVTFSRDVAPILQRSCESCHRPDGVAPMSLVSYNEVRPWAPIIKHRTALRDRAGAMPPYYVERGIGIQHYQDDLRLTDEEIETIALWSDSGAPEGNPADLPPPVEWSEVGAWTLGRPDLIIRTEDFYLEGGSPDWWGDMPSVPTGLTEDRYVSAVEIREINDAGRDGGETVVGGRWIVHHMIWSTRATDEDGNAQSTGWPVHELGRNPDIFDPRAGRLLRAGSDVVSNSVHLHSNGRDTRAHLEIGFHFHPVGYEPEYRAANVGLGDGMNIDIRGNEDGQELHAYTVLQQHTKITSFEPHLHGPGQRMCLQAIFGNLIETLSCSGYDHNWVRQYTFHDDYAPLLPRGTILHLVGFMDNTENNPNVPDPRNWQGSGNRSVTNMFIDLGTRAALTDEQFVREMAERRERLGLGVNDHLLGCPLCMAEIPLFETEDGDTD